MHITPEKERARKLVVRFGSILIFATVVGLILMVKLFPDYSLRFVPVVLFGIVGVGGLVNVALNLRFYREGRFLNGRITQNDSPVRYWLLFFVFTLLSVGALVVAILMGTGVIGKKPPNYQTGALTVAYLPLPRSSSSDEVQFLEVSILGRWNLSDTKDYVVLSKDASAQMTRGGRTVLGSYYMGAPDVLILKFPSSTPSGQPQVWELMIRLEDVKNRILRFPTEGKN